MQQCSWCRIIIVWKTHWSVLVLMEQKFCNGHAVFMAGAGGSIKSSLRVHYATAFSVRISSTLSLNNLHDLSQNETITTKVGSVYSHKVKFSRCEGFHDQGFFGMISVLFNSGPQRPRPMRRSTVRKRLRTPRRRPAVSRCDTHLFRSIRRVELVISHVESKVFSCVVAVIQTDCVVFALELSWFLPWIAPYDLRCCLL